ncbi:MAG: hypothetical protein AAF108_05030 [Planctomycetota bacterium]
MRRTTRALAAAGLTLTFGLAGCKTYYEVSVPGTTDTYYTTSSSIKKERGSIEFLDQATGSILVLSSAQLRPIPKQEFRANTGTD